MTATSPDRRSTAPLAWVVTLAVLSVVVLVVVLASFSQSNTPQSINGTTATSTHWNGQG